MLLQIHEANPIKGKRCEQKLYKRRYINDQYAYENIFKISHQGNENENTMRCYFIFVGMAKA